MINLEDGVLAGMGNVIFSIMGFQHTSVIIEVSGKF